MKANVMKLLIVIVAFTFLSSCTHHLVGVWNVNRFETKTPTQEGAILQNIGTIEFLKDGNGTKDIHYTVLGLTQEDKIPFTWKWVDNKYVTITSEGSEFSKTWIIMQNKKNFQQWQSTDGTEKIQVLELKK
jgi:hypothetical protein